MRGSRLIKLRAPLFALAAARCAQAFETQRLGCREKTHGIHDRNKTLAPAQGAAHVLRINLVAKQRHHADPLFVRPVNFADFIHERAYKAVAEAYGQDVSRCACG